MQHLDEGTIHAWLDGELPFEESSRVTAHAAACDKCTAMIAEARGFLAASSRILGNLDEIPGDVVPPGHAPATSPGGTSMTPRDLGIVLPVGRTSGPRRWIPSRFAAAAAVAVLAVGTYTILNRSTPSARTEFSIPSADVAPRAEVDLKDSAALSAANEAAAPSTERAAQAVGAAAPRIVAAPPVPTVPTPKQVAARKDQPAASTGRGADIRADAAAVPTRPTEAERRPSPPAAQLAAAPAATAADSAVKKAEAGGVAVVRDSGSFVAAEALRARAPVASPARTLAVPPESVITMERRRLVGEVDSGLQNVVVTGAAARAEAREAAKILPEISSGRSLTLRTAPGCYDIMRGDAEMQAGVPPSVRLATAQIRVGRRALRLAVPQGQAAAGRDVRWYWSLGGGRVILHKVTGGAVEYEGQIVAVRRPC